MAHRTSWPGWRKKFGRLPFARSTYALLWSLKDLILDTPQRSYALLNRQYEERMDPWDALASEQTRYQSVLTMLDDVRGDQRFRAALEIGCAEGVFTKVLASRCESLQAVDFSEIALNRARNRCRQLKNVRFDCLDLRCDPLPGQFDLVVVMAVVEYFKRPGAVRAARPKLVNAVQPGGYLFIGNSRQSELFESTWWGKRLLRGGKWINAFVAEDSELRLVAEEVSDLSVNTLFHRVREPSLGRPVEENRTR